MAMLNLNGYTDLPPGKLAAVVTFLEMTNPPAPSPVTRDDVLLRRWRPGNLEDYRHLFRRVGEPWLWFSRLAMDDETLREILEDPAVEVYFIEYQGEAAGLLELDRRRPPDVEIAFLGLVAELTGKGIGPYVLSQASALGFREGAARLWLHTCTLDHPAALKAYCKAGFRPYRRAIEVADDPRLTGLLDPRAAPAIPLL